MVKAWLALSDNSGIATDAFSFLVTKGVPEFDSTEAFKMQAQIVNEQGRFADSYEWKMICGLYLAEGGETHLTFGNFKINDETSIKPMKKAGAFAYYFVDDLSFEPLTDFNMGECGLGFPIGANTEEVELTTTRFFQDLSLPQLINGKPFTFDGFYFEFDKYDILDSNYRYLDSLLFMLEENPTFTMEVVGHTDDVGSDSYNERLSKNRALAVVQYFIDEGINKKRISYSYFGATKPVATNTSAEGRQQNRRVEFVIQRE